MKHHDFSDHAPDGLPLLMLRSGGGLELVIVLGRAKTRQETAVLLVYLWSIMPTKSNLTISATARGTRLWRGLAVVRIMVRIGCSNYVVVSSVMMDCCLLFRPSGYGITSLWRCWYAPACDGLVEVTAEYTC